jgi:hypothetical protein
MCELSLITLSSISAWNPFITESTTIRDETPRAIAKVEINVTMEINWLCCLEKSCR